MQTTQPTLTTPPWQIWGAGVLVLICLVVVLTGHRLPALFAGQETPKKPSLRAQLGIFAMDRALGQAAPTGRGVVMGHVEGHIGDYLPNTAHRRYHGVMMTPVSGPSKVNGHAESTARRVYGRHGLAPGIEDVRLYASDHWLGHVVKVSSSEGPDPQGVRLFTHSWISNDSPSAPNTLRRIDYLADQYDVMMTVGVNNKAKSLVPALLGSAYNVIAVGAANGRSSGKYTRVEGEGRCKPDIIAPQEQTSYSTPAVAAVVARLFETADGMTHQAPHANQSEVIKAVLMAGAEKPTGWQPQPGKPLDEHMGAGSARCDTSYLILKNGPVGRQHGMGRYGWDFDTLVQDQQAGYTFETDEPLGECSVMLVWNRRIDGREVTDLFTQRTRWLDTPRLADFDLRLVRVDSQGRGQAEIVVESASKVDNIEHLYIKELPPGRYTFQVDRHDDLKEGWDYALAWRIEEPRLKTISR